MLRASVTDPRRPLRVALYSHDAQGLGHVRRNLAIAAALGGGSDGVDVLLFSGSEAAALLERPPRCDVVTLPALRKRADGTYVPRNLSGGLAELLAIRSAALTSTLIAFAPDLLIVDKLASGAFGELMPALERLTARGRTRTVLGLRDVLDDPQTTRREWREQRAFETIARFYDALWVYGDPAVFDAVTEYELPASLVAQTTFTGYLARGRDARPALAAAPAGAPFVLGLVGGGQDGRRLAEAFAATRFPPGHRGLLVTGPQMGARDRAAIDRAASGRSDLAIHDFLPAVSQLIGAAAAVVSMGGYNATCELLATSTPGLIAPRTTPRSEQLIRATRLAARGALDCLHPVEVNPGALSGWLGEAVRRPRLRRTGLDLDGLGRLPGLAAALMRPALTEVSHVAA